MGIEHGNSSDLAKEQARGRNGASVRRLMARGNLPWHRSEDPSIVDGLRWLFESGWFDDKNAIGEDEITATDHRLYRQYYEDYLLYVNHPLWKKTVAIAKKLDARYFGVTPGHTKELSDEEVKAFLEELTHDEVLTEFWKHLVAERFVVYKLGNTNDVGELYEEVLKQDIARKHPPTVQFLQWKQQQALALKVALPDRPRRQ